MPVKSLNDSSARFQIIDAQYLVFVEMRATNKLTYLDQLPQFHTIEKGTWWQTQKPTLSKDGGGGGWGGEGVWFSIAALITSLSC